MNASDLVIVGLFGRVAGLRKSAGSILWSTDLPGIIGDRFVSVTADQTNVYAHTHGQLHCLDLASGRILWTNDLPGYGYGIASICLPGSPASLQPAVQATQRAAARSDSLHQSET